MTDLPQAPLKSPFVAPFVADMRSAAVVLFTLLAACGGQIGSEADSVTVAADASADAQDGANVPGDREALPKDTVITDAAPTDTGTRSDANTDTAKRDAAVDVPTAADVVTDTGPAQCPSAYPTRCGSGCYNTMTNPFHCGLCNHPCSNGSSCVNGVCAQAYGGKCGTGRAECGDGCAIAGFPFKETCNGTCAIVGGSDVNNCGGCDVRCAPGQVCFQGACSR